MGKRTLVALGIVAAVFAAGYLVCNRAIDSDKTAAVVLDAAPVVVADAATVIAGGRVVVTAVAGTVERRNPDGSWVALEQGAELSLDDVIRTSEDGTARLDLGDAATVAVAEATEFTVAEVSASLSRVRLEDGRVTAKVYGQTGSRLKVEVKGSDAVAESGRGEFSVLSDGAGQVAVAAKEGTVALSAAGKTVEVGAGQQSVVAKGSGPSAPEKIPPSLFLKVRGGGKVQRARETTIRGTTRRGAIVSINGVRAPVGDDGGFETRVALREGENQVRVEVVDVSGRRQEKSVGVTVDSKPPDVSGEVDWN